MSETGFQLRPAGVQREPSISDVRLTGGFAAELGRPTEENLTLMRAVNLVLKEDGRLAQNQAFAY